MVEQIAPEITRSRTASLNRSRKLPLYMDVALFLFTGFTVVIVLTWVLVQNRTPLPNPFALFADILPGQPESNARARGFSPPISDYSFYHSPSEQYSILDLETGIFSHILITINQDIIRQTSFVMRDDTLTVGDLAMFLGTSDIQVSPQVVYFDLPETFVIAKTVADGRRSFSPFLIVWSVSFREARV
jgi:hypothetical protein